jgi:lysophospholipase L1-like esterase
MPSASRTRLLRTLAWWLRKLSIALCSALVTLALAEIVARQLAPPDLVSFRQIYRRSEVAGYRLKPDLREFALGSDVRTNEHGFRGPAWSRAKPPGTLRIALIGDSIAFGFGVEEEEAFGSRLESSLTRRLGRRCELLCFAVPGYNAQQQLELLEQEVFGFEPDLVLVQACTNDHEERLYAGDDGYLHLDEATSERLRVGAEHLPRKSRWGPLRHSVLIMWARRAWSQKVQREKETRQRAAFVAQRSGPPQLPKLEDVPAPIREGVGAPLEAMRELCARRGVPMAVLLYGWDPRYLVLLRELGTRVPVLELAELFPETPSWEEFVLRYSLGWDLHPNAEVHARCARGIEDFLVARELVR